MYPGLIGGGFAVAFLALIVMVFWATFATPDTHKRMPARAPRKP
jgi:hypothetical protein